MIVDALVLAGGRSARLGGVAKAALVVEGRTLLERTLDATADARATVVVADAQIVASAAPGRAVSVVRESPAFAGPAAGIAAGVEFLARSAGASDFTLVLACDMPRVAEAVTVVQAAATNPDGAVAVAPDGRVQPLVGLYPSAALAAAVRAHRVVGSLENLSVRTLLADLHPAPIRVPAGSTDDIDTWDDAEAVGIGGRERERRRSGHE